MSTDTGTWTIWWNAADVDQTTIEVHNEPAVDKATVAETSISHVQPISDHERVYSDTDLQAWASARAKEILATHQPHGDTSAPAA